MSASQTTWKHKAFEAAAVLMRWALGAFFIYMGLKKAMHPVEFLKLARQYEMVHSPFLLNSIAAGLPWFETFCGILLLMGVAVRGTALTLVGVLVPFTWLVLRRALALQALHGIPFCAVKFDCGCGAGEVFICRKLTENFILILVSCWLVSGMGRAFCARHTLLSGKTTSGGLKTQQ
jgi:uncharacterized membrane protein YphA (DoxX/SURF4 family)